MRKLPATLLIACFAGCVLAQGALAQDKPAAAKKAEKGTIVATGQHRGYTNDKLHFLPDGGKELTLLVEIPGDNERKWHKVFETLSRVTVTYRIEADSRLVATSIKKAPQ